MDLNISGMTALVCGASRGLGLACAEALAAEGVQPTLVARSEQGLKSAAERIEAKTGCTAQVIVADLSIEDEVLRVVDRCKAPDILITNAGGPRSGDFRSLTRADWTKAF